MCMSLSVCATLLVHLQTAHGCWKVSWAISFSSKLLLQIGKKKVSWAISFSSKLFLQIELLNCKEAFNWVVSELFLQIESHFAAHLLELVTSYSCDLPQVFFNLLFYSCDLPKASGGRLCILVKFSETYLELRAYYRTLRSLGRGVSCSGFQSVYQRERHGRGFIFTGMTLISVPGTWVLD